MDKVVLKKKVVVDLKTDFAREGGEEEARGAIKRSCGVLICRQRGGGLHGR